MTIKRTVINLVLFFHLGTLLDETLNALLHFMLLQICLDAPQRTKFWSFTIRGRFVSELTLVVFGDPKKNMCFVFLLKFW